MATSGDRVYFTAVLGGPSGNSSSTGGNGDSSGSGETSPAATAGPVVMPVQKATPQADGSIIHTVQTGQTLWTIAAVYEMQLEDLYKLNEMNQYSFVFPGDEIIIRPPGNYPDKEQIPDMADQTEETKSSQTPNATQLVGEAFSYSAQATPETRVTKTPIPTTVVPPTEEPQTAPLFEEDPTARNLIIGAFVILVIVLVGSIFIQTPTRRAPEDDDGE